MSTPHPGTGPAAAISDAFVAYPSPAGTVMALRGLDLTVQPGERVLVQGPNGSGKSTMLRLLTGEQAATAGSVKVGGTELDRLGARARRRWRVRGVGLVDQHARRALLPEWPVLDNVALQLRLGGMAPAAARARAGATLERLGLTELAGRSVGPLSGGEAQRVAICAALAHEPFLLLADEPTGELDDDSARDVCALLARAGGPGGTALLLVSHDDRAADLVDRAVRVRDGRLAEQWQPGRRSGRSVTGEEQVMDAHGWVRIPSQLLAGPARLRAETGGPVDTGIVRLTPTTPVLATPRPDDAAPVSVATLPPADTGRPELLTLSGVGVRFGSHTLFHNLDLTVRTGDWVVVRGPSGSGKSTLLGLAAGLTDPDAGSVALGGQPVRPLSRAARAELRGRLLAVALQGTFLADALTVLENLQFAQDLRPPELTANDDPSSNIEALIAALGLPRLIHQPVGLLSGGERQRVALARCLVSAAPLLILDEPTSQQDEASAVLVAGILTQAVRAGRGVVAASHDDTFTAAADQVLRLDARAAQPPR